MVRGQVWRTSILTWPASLARRSPQNAGHPCLMMCSQRHDHWGRVDFAADEAVCRRCHAQIYDRLLPSRQQRGGSVQDAALAGWAAASRHNAGVLVAVLHTYQQVEWETPAGELVRRPPPPTDYQAGAGRCRYSHAFHWQDRAFTGPSTYENILVGQREHAAAVRHIDLWPRAKLGSCFELWKRSRLPSGTEAAQDLLPSRRRCLMCPSPFDTSYPPPPPSPHPIPLRGNAVLPYRRHRWPCSSWLGRRRTSG